MNCKTTIHLPSSSTGFTLHFMPIRRNSFREHISVLNCRDLKACKNSAPSPFTNAGCLGTFHIPQLLCGRFGLLEAEKFSKSSNYKRSAFGGTRCIDKTCRLQIFEIMEENTRNLRDGVAHKSENILPKTVVDSGIARPTETDFCFCNAENIGRDSTIKVLPRTRGGYGNMSNVTLKSKSFDEHIKSLPEDELFEERNVPTNLIGNATKIRNGRSRGGLECLLLKLGRQTFHKLFEMISLYHVHNKCLDGMFEHQQIRYIPVTDSFIIDPEHLGSKIVRLTPDGYEKDNQALAKVLERVCELKFKSLRVGIYPAYIAHLLRIMKSMPEGAKNSNTFKAFLRNHPCMMSPGSRQGLILEVHAQMKFQPRALQKKMASGLGRYNGWGIVAKRVPAFEAVYNYRRQQYSEDKMSWFDFCRNFISHPTENECPDFTMEDADLALLYHFGDRLAEHLCLIACTDGFTSTVFDLDWFRPTWKKVKKDEIASILHPNNTQTPSIPAQEDLDWTVVKKKNRDGVECEDHSPSKKGKKKGKKMWVFCSAHLTHIQNLDKGMEPP